MLFRRPAGLTAGLVCLAALAAAPAAHAAPANVILRVEGAPSTLVEEAGLRTTLQPVNKSGAAGEECTGTSAAGALEQGTAGDWNGPYFGPGLGYSVERIRQESYPFDNPDRAFWTLWVNNRASQTGICQTELQEGDEVLFFVDRCDFDGQRCANDPVLPLGLRAPAGGRTDAPAEVSVVRYDPQGATEPVGGARVTGPSVDATTSADGTASVRFGQDGPVRLKASKPGSARSAAETVQVLSLIHI